MKRPTYIYFIKPVGMDGPIKIGCSRCAKGRLVEIARWAPMPLEIVGMVPGSFKDERTLHRAFAHLQEHMEWFAEGADLVAAIALIIEAGSVSAIRGKIRQGVDISKPGHRAWTEDRKHRQSFSLRLAHIRDRLNKELPSGWDTPSDIKAVMRAWSRGSTPSHAEALSLERYLADPIEYVASSERKEAA